MQHLKVKLRELVEAEVAGLTTQNKVEALVALADAMRDVRIELRIEAMRLDSPPEVLTMVEALKDMAVENLWETLNDDYGHHAAQEIIDSMDEADRMEEAFSMVEQLKEDGCYHCGDPATGEGQPNPKPWLIKHAVDCPVGNTLGSQA